MPATILYPMFALATWTFLVLLLVGGSRIRAGMRAEIVPDDFKFGTSGNVPDQLNIPNRNYMNLLELPLLFYVICLLIYVTSQQTTTLVTLAWAYVVLRIVHSAVHLTYNKVLHRLFIFLFSNAVLVTMWIVAAYGLPAMF